MLFIAAIFGLGWWVMNMILFVPNISTITDDGNAASIPLFWMWDNIGNNQRGWTALAYLSGFFINAFVSVVEFAAFIFYLMGRNWWFGWWVNYPGMIGAIFLSGMAPVFSILQLALPTAWGGLGGVSEIEYGYNSIVFALMGLIIWFNNAGTHILLGQRLQCHIDAQPEPRPRVVRKCVIRKKEGQSDEDY